MNDLEGVVEVKGADFFLEFDKRKGTFSKMEKSGKNVLRDNGGPILHLWRAPHQKDDMWAYEDWDKNGLRKLTWVAKEVRATRLVNGTIEIKASLTGTGKHNFTVHHDVVYAINGNGVINATNNVSFSDTSLVLARIGVRMFLNKELDQFDYLGRGPMENYADRKSGFDVGHYTGSVSKQLTPYEKPMEAGNHEDVRWANVISDDGWGIRINNLNSLLQVSALPYSDEEMEPVEYREDLPKSKGTVLCISHQTLGVGSYGCGPKPLEQYLVHAKPTTFKYQIQL